MKTSRRIFILSVFAAICICMPVPYEILHYWIDQRELREQTVSSVLAIDRCGGNQTFLGKRKKFDLVLHARLMKTFPDWEARMNYQKKQEEFYKLAIKKQTQVKRLRIKDTSGFYTKEEVDAINYFHGKGFYAKEQDPNVQPNIFDTRQSFLIKMHDPILRRNFLNSLNSQTN